VGGQSHAAKMNHPVQSPPPHDEESNRAGGLNLVVQTPNNSLVWSIFEIMRSLGALESVACTSQTVH